MSHEIRFNSKVITVPTSGSNKKLLQIDLCNFLMEPIHRFVMAISFRELKSTEKVTAAITFLKIYNQKGPWH